MQLNRHSQRTFAPRLGVAALLIVIASTPHTLLGQAVPKASYEANGSFQLPGKGQPGSPDQPLAIARGPNSTLHVVDGRGLVFVFDSAGLYRRSYGQDALDDPVAVEVTPENIAYVLDKGRKQIFVFGPGGQVLRRLSESGGKGGQLSDPIDMALGPAGFIYVLDSGRDGIQIFSLDGLFVRDILLGATIRDPRSLAVGNDGTIYVADEDTPGGVYAMPPFTELPWVGPLQGIVAPVNLRGAQLGKPVAMAVNDLGTVVVLDQETGRLWRQNKTGSAALGANDMLYGGAGTGRGSFREAQDVTFIDNEHAVILDGDLRKVERIRLTTEGGLQRRPDFAFPIRVSQVPRGLPRPLLGVVYDISGAPSLLLDIERNAVQLMGTQVEMHETVYGDSVPVYLPDPTEQQRQFTQEIGRVAAATASDGRLLVLDQSRDRFAVFALAGGAPEGIYGDNYRDNRRLDDPGGMVVLRDGRIVIADTGNDRIKIFSSDLASLVAEYAFPGPAGVAATPGGDIWTWSEDGTRVSRLTPSDGSFQPLAPDLLPGPIAALTFDHAGNMFLLDRENHRVTIIDDARRKIWIQLGAEDAFDRPERIVVDREGNIYIADGGAKRTHVYRWDVAFPPLRGFDLTYDGDAAVLSWQSGPRGFVRGYEIQGSTQPDGPYRAMGRTEAPPFRIEAGSPQLASVPRYVRVAPIYITGVRGRGSPPLPFAYFAARAAYERQEYRLALQISDEALALMAQGAMDDSEDSKGRVLYMAFGSAYALGEFNRALEYAQQLSGVRQPNARLIPFLYQLADIYLRAGDASQASQHILSLVGQGPRPEYYRDPAVISQSFLIYDRMRQSGHVADALEFIRLYTQSIPNTLQDLKDQYTDSIIVFSTRDKLGPGLQYWANADYGAAVNFFEGQLTEGGLTVEQSVIARQVLAASYYAFGRRVEAEDTFREIFNVRPQFDLEREIPRIRTLYDLTIYNPETRRFFGALTPRS